MRFTSLQPVWAIILTAKFVSLSRVCLSFVSGVLLLFSMGCDFNSNTLRAAGGQQNQKAARQQAEQNERLEKLAHIETETIDQANALAVKASLEYMESTRTIALLVTYLREDEAKRKLQEPEIKFEAAKSEKDPMSVQIVQSQSSSTHDISSDQTFSIQATKAADGKINLDQMTVRWLENVKLDRKSKGTILETRHEFEFQIVQESEKIFNVIAKDAKIYVVLTSEKLRVDAIGDLSFKLLIEDAGKVTVKNLKLEKARLTSQEKSRSRAPVLSMSSDQSLILQLKSASENPKSMSSSCYDIDSGAFTSGDDQASLTTLVEDNRVTLKTKSIHLSSCPTANFIDARKWIPTERTRKKTTNLKLDRELIFE